MANSASHCASVSGGIAPVIGFHSVIESPDSVSRVMPPTTTIANTKAATKRSQAISREGAGLGDAGRASAMPRAMPRGAVRHKRGVVLR